MRLSPRRCFQWTQPQGTGAQPHQTPSEQTHPASSSASVALRRTPVHAGWTHRLHRPALVRRAQRSMPAALAAQQSMLAARLATRHTQLSSNRRNSTDSNSSYGDMPTAMAEQVGAPNHGPL